MDQKDPFEAHFDEADLEEAELMAAVLEGRHGTYAADVATFFSGLHLRHGDAERSRAWAGVAQTVQKRTVQRLLEA